MSRKFGASKFNHQTGPNNLLASSDQPMFVFLARREKLPIQSCDIRPGNSQEECTNGCKNGARPGCQQFCDCIYNQGNPLNACLDEYQKGKEADASKKRQPQ